MLEKIKLKRSELVKESNNILNELNEVLEGFETLLDNVASIQEAEEKLGALIKKGKELNSRYEQLENTAIKFIGENNLGNRTTIILGFSCISTIKKIEYTLNLISFDYLEREYFREG